MMSRVDGISIINVAATLICCSNGGSWCAYHAPGLGMHCIHVSR